MAVQASKFSKIDDEYIGKLAFLLASSSVEIMTRNVNEGVKKKGARNFGGSWNEYLGIVKSTFKDAIPIVQNKNEVGIQAVIIPTFIDFLYNKVDSREIFLKLQEYFPSSQTLDTRLSLIFAAIASMFSKSFQNEGWFDESSINNIDFDIIQAITDTILYEKKFGNISSLKIAMGSSLLTIINSYESRKTMLEKTLVSRLDLYRKYFGQRFSYRGHNIVYQNNATSGGIGTLKLIKDFGGGTMSSKDSNFYIVIASIDMILSSLENSFGQIWPKSAFINTPDNIYISSLTCGWHSLWYGLKKDVGNGLSPAVYEKMENFAPRIYESVEEAKEADELLLRMLS